VVAHLLQGIDDEVIGFHGDEFAGLGLKAVLDGGHGDQKVSKRIAAC
jgi:hypothetical protein